MSNKQVVKSHQIRAGITIYRAQIIGGYVETIRVASKPYIVNLGTKDLAMFADEFCFSDISDLRYKTNFSLKDAGIIPNRYNMAKTFHSHKAAQRYLDEVVKSSEYETLMKRHNQFIADMDDLDYEYES